MTFYEAVKQLDNGNKVRITCWKDNEYITLDKANNNNNNVVDAHGCTYTLSNPDFRADWELYDDIEDGDLFKDTYGHTVRVWKLSNGNYLLLGRLVEGQTKQDLSKFIKQYHLKKVDK